MGLCLQAYLTTTINPKSTKRTKSEINRFIAQDDLDECSERLDLESDQNQIIVLFSNILWCVWKARNEQIFKGTVPTPQGIIAQAAVMGQANTVPAREIDQERREVIDLPVGTLTILIDASWDGTKKTGTAFLCFNEEKELVFTHVRHTRCEDPFHAEAQALVEALQFVQGQTSTQPVLPATIYLDRKTGEPGECYRTR